MMSSKEVYEENDTVQEGASTIQEPGMPAGSGMIVRPVGRNILPSGLVGVIKVIEPGSLMIGSKRNLRKVGG